jgi:hypothetical protein
MTRKTNKVENNFDIGDLPDSQNINATPEKNLTLEQIIADELLDDIDWKAVNKALLKGLRRKFIRWFVSGNSLYLITPQLLI